MTTLTLQPQTAPGTLTATHFRVIGLNTTFLDTFIGNVALASEIRTDHTGQAHLTYVNGNPFPKCSVVPLSPVSPDADVDACPRLDVQPDAERLLPALQRAMGPVARPDHPHVTVSVADLSPAQQPYEHALWLADVNRYLGVNLKSADQVGLPTVLRTLRHTPAGWLRHPAFVDALSTALDDLTGLLRLLSHEHPGQGSDFIDAQAQQIRTKANLITFTPSSEEHHAVQALGLLIGGFRALPHSLFAPSGETLAPLILDLLARAVTMRAGRHRRA